jgi:hypothetical protein
MFILVGPQAPAIITNVTQVSQLRQLNQIKSSNTACHPIIGQLQLAFSSADCTVYAINADALCRFSCFISCVSRR